MKMDDVSPQTMFLAVLVYEDGNFGAGWRCEEPRFYSASHPEIAYQAALVDGNEQRYDRTFLGLSHLEETTEGVEPIARTQKGDARELVVAKEKLEAFSDPRWKGLPWNEEELAAALREPSVLFEVDGLNSIRWHEYTHAYGPASDVPKDIRRLTSTDPAVREQALWQLGGSIYHQGSIYGATAVAVPFLLRIIVDHRLEGRAQLCELLAEIARSSAIHPDVIRKNHDWRREKLGPSFPAPSEEMIQREIAAVTATRQAFLNHLEEIRLLTFDADPEVRKFGKAILQLTETPLSPTVPCSYCGGSGACRCKRVSSADSAECKRCNSTGKCHVCHGSGIR
jgi:hypothetical protein